MPSEPNSVTLHTFFPDSFFITLLLCDNQEG